VSSRGGVAGVSFRLLVLLALLYLPCNSLPSLLLLLHRTPGFLRPAHAPPPPLLLGMPRTPLADPAYHRNVGDHMITLGELEFVRRSRLGALEGHRGDDEEESATEKRTMLMMVDQCGYVQSGSFAEPCDAYLNWTIAAAESSALAAKDAGSSSFSAAAAAAAAAASPRLADRRRVALWHGGGNWGDLWRTLHPARIRSLESLLRHEYAVVGMPQSLYYRDASRAEDDAQLLWDSIVRGLQTHGEQEGEHNASAPWTNLTQQLQRTDPLVQVAKSRVFLCWREVESYQQAELLYPFVTNLLVPDIAFQLGPYDRPTPTTPLLDLVLLLRDDHESTQQAYRSKAAVRSLLSTIPGADRLSFRIVDWDDRLELFESDNIFFSETSIQLLSMGRVVICDRLHAAILCYLAGIPFVYLDQVSGKITKSLNVAFESDPICLDSETAMWSRADNVTHALQTSVAFLTKYRLN
jgi:exopolysaccharide biosynthesis predicted pyruvyltransferase EpsI